MVESGMVEYFPLSQLDALMKAASLFEDRFKEARKQAGRFEMRKSFEKGKMPLKGLNEGGLSSTYDRKEGALTILSHAVSSWAIPA